MKGVRTKCEMQKRGGFVHYIDKKMRRKKRETVGGIEGEVRDQKLRAQQ